jgi:hypothetical protein
MKKILKRLMILLALIIVIWIILTIWAESEGPSRIKETGNVVSAQNALIVYDPDPFYNLDQQVCESFGSSLAANGWRITIATIAAAKKIKNISFQVYVFCANTYNWAPDWAVSSFIKNYPSLEGKKAVVITLGGGSTTRSQRVFEKIIKRKGATIIDSRSLWLWRPNDESRMKESNVKVAVDIARSWGNQIAIKLK